MLWADFTLGRHLAGRKTDIVLAETVYEHPSVVPRTDNEEYVADTTEPMMFVE